MSGTGNRRLVGWLTATLVGLLLTGYIAREQFASGFAAALALVKP